MDYYKIKKGRVSDKLKKYASLRFSTTKSKAQCAREAGYSPSMANVPQTIEKSIGFSKLMAELAKESGQVTKALIYEIQERQKKGELESYTIKEIIDMLDTMSKSWERFTPKKKEQDGNNPLADIFHASVINVTDAETEEKGEETTEDTKDAQEGTQQATEDVIPSLGDATGGHDENDDVSRKTMTTP